MTWRQHRAAAAVGGAVLLALAAGLVVLGITARSNVRHVGLTACVHSGADCSAALSHLEHDYHWLPPIAASLVVLPLLAGVFWGAPLIARELETGTYRLAWTQSVSRLRWISTKLSLILGVTAAGILGLSLLAVWAFRPLIPVFGNRFRGGWFDVQGIVPAAYILFALVLGSCLGAVWRRTTPAMATTMVGYAAVRIPVHNLRRLLLTAQVKIVSFPLGDAVQNAQKGVGLFPASGLAPGDWVIKTTLLDPTGHPITDPTPLVGAYCPQFQPRSPLPHECVSKLAAVKLQAVYRYQTRARFWTLQSVEAAIFLLLTAALAALCITLVVRSRPH